ncbi:hypothetical protein ISF_04485 [Cordyceps fumosorosea ARSEF 2679]|uniref:Regulatory P domain-containing protein n=1 Tax=Cordyceps fumosorosea (strain ARSEF 2679) TaxID=1081104 RepID=A0A167WGY2_CORFA|nr:hypothetical protein ISF_04485 [Cordyceps fumosorosea ARSEF 2679]OAA63776.1 hypothetical protein ISF_04485 [Cordyceps fumosorosea ARSEF 2679]
MKAPTATLILAGVAAGTSIAYKGSVAFSAQELAADSAPNAVSMSKLMSAKMSQRAQHRADGAYDAGRYAAAATSAKCSNGKAGDYSCRNIDLAGFLSHEDTGSSTREGNDIWAWTSSTGREFGLVGQTDGTAFVEVLKDGSLQYIGRLPTQDTSNIPNDIWRDIKTIGNYAYIGADTGGSSDNVRHGVQVFDLTKLLNVDLSSPTTFKTDSDLTAHFDGFGFSHNIVTNEATNTITAVGTMRTGTCKGGLWMIDVSDPSNPTTSGCYSGDGYTHDAQCVNYNGPDKSYKGREICFASNEDTLTIVDVTDRKSPKMLSKTTYKGASYTHQNWFADEGMRYLLLDDEQDEMNKAGPAADQKTTTYIVDVSSLAKPVFTGVYKSPAKAIDHNQYVVNGISYQANYGSGLRMVDVSSVTNDPTGAGFSEAGFFDVHPDDDASGGEATFHGAWSVYPWLKSGYLLVNSIERGVFSVKYTG